MAKYTDQATEQLAHEKDFATRWKILRSTDRWAWLSAIVSSGAMFATLLEFLARLIGDNAGIEKFIRSIWLAIIPAAKSAPAGELVIAALSPREYLVMWMFFSLSILFFWCIWAISKSPSAATITLAKDLLKTLSGFFIGTITGFMGK